jgi:hypothetical protein
MECEQCRGLTAKERFCDFLQNDGQVYVGGWRWYRDARHVAM